MATKNSIADTPFGELNSYETSRSKKPFVSKSNTKDRLEDDYYNPDVTKQKLFFEGFVVEKGKLVPIENLNIKPSKNHENAKNVLVVKVWIPEIHRNEHPDVVMTDDSGKELSREEMIAIMPSCEFVSVSSEISQKGVPDVDDIVIVSFDDRSSLSNPTYHGIKEKASTNSGSKKKNIEKNKDKTPGLEDTTNAPNAGTVTPVLNSNPSTPEQPQQNTKKPGTYPVHKKSTQPYAYLNMILIPGASLLYPKRYEKVITTMMQKYENDTGKKLGIISAYRDVNKQQDLYNEYLQRNKSPPKVAKPGFSKHNNGVAIDFGTGKISNDKYTGLFYSKDKPSGENAYLKAQNGEFGEVAKWLSTNSSDFGFEWTGYSFGELWHYELNPDKIPSSLIGDESGDEIV